MQKTKFKKFLSFAVCTVLVAAIALFTTGCNGEADQPQTPETDQSTALTAGETIVLGEGATAFNFGVTFPDGSQEAYTIQTDKATVGEALQELGLIDGEEGPYGLYVKAVGGETLDYDTDGKYWAFYIDGEMAMSGVDKTEIEAGTVYSFAATAA